MNQEMLANLMLFITILTPITTAIVEVIKRTIPKLPANYYTLLAIVFGIGLASLGWVFTDLSATYRLWGGLFAGLASAKVYDITKELVNVAKK